MSFLKDGYRVEYKIGGKIYQVFLVKNGSPDIANEVFTKYQGFLGSHHEKVSHSQKQDYRFAFTESERAVVIFQYGSFVGGVLNSADLSKAEEIIKEIIQKLKRVD